MSWITAIIIIFVAAMAFGPLMWFRSTPSQRREVEARKCAAELGLRVRLTPVSELNLPWLDSSDTVAAYCLVPQPTEKAEGKAPLEAQSWRLIKERISHEAHFDGYWNWQRKRAAEPGWHEVLREALGQLPKDALALDYDRGTFCIYWRERGGREEVEHLAGVLREILERTATSSRQVDQGDLA